MLRAWSVVPRGSKTAHITRHGNPMKTYCGKRFASVSEYRLMETSLSLLPDCKTCVRLFRKYEEAHK